MSRTVQITYARLTETPRTAFDLSTGTGSISVDYTVGTDVPAVTNPDGSILGPLRIDRPDCANQTTASVPLGPTDTAAERFQALVGTILAQEQLTPTAGDAMYDASGTRLV